MKKIAKKIAAVIFLIIFICALQVTYINYRLEQKLDDIQLKQQNILTKVYALERQTEQVNQTVRNTLQKQQLNFKEKHNFLLTNSELPNKKTDKQKREGVN